MKSGSRWVVFEKDDLFNQPDKMLHDLILESNKLGLEGKSVYMTTKIDNPLNGIIRVKLKWRKNGKVRNYWKRIKNSLERISNDPRVSGHHEGCRGEARQSEADT
jgi:hypothetical protein